MPRDKIKLSFFKNNFPIKISVQIFFINSGFCKYKIILNSQ